MYFIRPLSGSFGIALRRGPGWFLFALIAARTAAFARGDGSPEDNSIRLARRYAMDLETSAKAIHDEADMQDRRDHNVGERGMAAFSDLQSGAKALRKTLQDSTNAVEDASDDFAQLREDYKAAGRYFGTLKPTPPVKKNLTILDRRMADLGALFARAKPPEKNGDPGDPPGRADPPRAPPASPPKDPDPSQILSQTASQSSIIRAESKRVLGASSAAAIARASGPQPSKPQRKEGVRDGCEEEPQYRHDRLWLHGPGPLQRLPARQQFF